MTLVIEDLAWREQSFNPVGVPQADWCTGVDISEEGQGPRLQMSHIPRFCLARDAQEGYGLDRNTHNGGLPR